MLMIQEPLTGEVATLVQENGLYQIYRFPSGQTLLVGKINKIKEKA